MLSMVLRFQIVFPTYRDSDSLTLQNGMTQMGTPHCVTFLLHSVSLCVHPLMTIDTVWRHSSKNRPPIVLFSQYHPPLCHFLGLTPDTVRLCFTFMTLDIMTISCPITINLPFTNFDTAFISSRTSHSTALSILLPALYLFLSTPYNYCSFC